ncbi:MAG: hypothetical protein MHPSP_001083, partial [Paramarteilia canceri]
KRIQKDKKKGKARLLKVGIFYNVIEKLHNQILDMVSDNSYWYGAYIMLVTDYRKAFKGVDVIALARNKDLIYDKRSLEDVRAEPSCKLFIYKPSVNVTNTLKRTVSKKKGNELDKSLKQDGIKAATNENIDSKSNIAYLSMKTGTSDADNDSSDSEIIIDFDQGMEINENMNSENAVNNLNELVEQRLETAVKTNCLRKIDSRGSALNDSKLEEMQKDLGLTYDEIDVLLGLNK